MLQQEAMIERTRRVCREDERLAAAMMYGSFVQGEGDEFSDIEFILFFEDAALESLDQREWVSRISPVGHYFVNEYGNGTAIFENLIRGEFHFDRFSEIATVVGESMRDADWLPSLEDTLVLDRTGELTRRLQMIVGPAPERDTPGQVRFLCGCFVNWFLFGSTTHWFSSSKFLESEISAASYDRYAACTARLNSDELRDAYLSAWEWGRELMSSLADRHGVVLPHDLQERLDVRFAGIFRKKPEEK